MTAGAWVLIVAVVAALSFGLYRAATDGRFRGTRRISASRTSLVEPVETPSSSSVETPSSSSVETPSPSSVEPVETTVADLAATDGLALELGERATLLQFSSAFCAPCRATRRTLAEVAEVVPGVVHVEVDAEHHLALVRSLGVLRTPTTLVLDARGVEITRAAGAPRKEQVLSALGAMAD